MSDPYGPATPSDPNQPNPPVPPAGPPVAPPYGATPSQSPGSPYGQAAPQYGQSAPLPQYGQPAAPPQYPQPGGFPTAPPATPYGAAGLAPQLRVGDALRFAWAKFTRNWLAWVVLYLGMAVVMVLLSAPLIGEYRDWIQRILDTPSGVEPDFTFGFTGGAILLAMVGAVASYVVQVFMWTGALREADGAHPSLGKFFSAPRAGAAILAGLVVGIVGMVVSLIPLGTLAWGIFSIFTVAFVLDRSQSPISAIGDSFRLVGKNFGSVFLLLLTLVGINILGMLVLLVGLLVTVPLSVLAMAYAFRRLTGGTIV